MPPMNTGIRMEINLFYESCEKAIIRTGIVVTKLSLNIPDVRSGGAGIRIYYKFAIFALITVICKSLQGGC